MLNLFYQGGVPFMTILTLILIALFLAAWKAPAWVNEIGKTAAVFGIFSTLLGFMQMGDAIAAAGEIAPRIIWSGVTVALITAVYGLIIYMISLIIRIVQKPRI